MCKLFRIRLQKGLCRSIPREAINRIAFLSKKVFLLLKHVQAISYSSPKGTLPFYTTRGHKPNRIPLQKAQIAITIIGELMRVFSYESSVAALASRGTTFVEQV
jgi:hypothetical protein